MPRPQTSRLSLKRALGLSTGLHLLLAPLFIASSALLIDLGRSTEAVRVSADDRVGLATIVIEHRREPKRPVAPVTHFTRTPVAVAVEPRRLVRTIRPSIRAARVARSVPTVVAAERPTGLRPQAHARLADSLPPPSQTAALPKPPADAVPVPVAPEHVTVAAPDSPSPSAEPTAASAAAPVRGYEVPNGGWGQNFEKPLLADTSALDDLRAKYHMPQPITVQVDETGKAIKIILPDSLASDARAEVERKLFAMHYVPAECNGLRCSGSLQLSL